MKDKKAVVHLPKRKRKEHPLKMINNPKLRRKGENQRAKKMIKINNQLNLRNKMIKIKTVY